MNAEINQVRTELLNVMAEAGRAALHFDTLGAAALAAIPNTEPQQYVIAGTAPMIAKLLPAVDVGSAVSTAVGEPVAADLSKRLRETARGGERQYSNASNSLLREAAETIERLAAPTQVSAPQAVPEVLLNAKAVYDELYKTSSCSSLEEVSDVLDAIVRLIRADAPQASAAQEVRAVPEGLAGLTRYMFTYEGMEVDNACGRYYLADDVDTFVERRLAAPTSTSTAPAAMDEGDAK